MNTAFVEEWRLSDDLGPPLDRPDDGLRSLREPLHDHRWVAAVIDDLQDLDHRQTELLKLRELRCLRRKSCRGCRTRFLRNADHDVTASGDRVDVLLAALTEVLAQ